MHFVKKNWVVIALFILMVAAFFVRVYKFDDYLYFKMDQSRDAMLIDKALEFGPGYLPLLGPRAGATDLDSGFLRLGPAYYYMQYAAGVLSGGNLPMSNAYPDLFFSIAVLPLLYIFLRLYFSRFNSLLITAMYSFSFLVIEYSRFSWNPNPLPFFFILAFYGLLRFFNEDDFKKSVWWISLWSFGIAVGAQLHFFGFFSLLGISGVMLLWHWRVWEKENWKSMFSRQKMKSLAIFGGVALGVFLFFSAPMIISDVLRGGENSKNFVQAIGSKPEKKPLIDKIEKNVSESFKYYCLLSTSECVSEGGFNKKNILTASLAIIFMLIGLAWAAFRLLKMKEQSPARRDFLFLLLAWTSVFFILSIPVAFQLRPRFYIVVFAVPFILLGFIFKMLQEKFGKRGIWVSIALAFLVLASNGKGTLEWFQEQKLSQQGELKIERTLILKAKDGVTLAQLQKAADFMYARHKDGSKLYYYVKPEHVAPLKFLLSQKNDSELRFASMVKEVEENHQIFAVTKTGDGISAFEKKFGKDLSVLAQEQLGQITVSEIRMDNLKTKKMETSREDTSNPDRIFWKDVFGERDETGNGIIEENEITEQSNE